MEKINIYGGRRHGYRAGQQKHKRSKEDWEVLRGDEDPIPKKYKYRRTKEEPQNAVETE